MAAEPENILILTQGEDYYTVVITKGVSPVGFANGLVRCEALELVASHLLGGAPPRSCQTIDQLAGRAKASIDKFNAKGSLVGQWMPAVYLANNGGVALCIREYGPNESPRVVVRLIRDGGAPTTEAVDRSSWISAYARWNADGRPDFP